MNYDEQIRKAFEWAASLELQNQQLQQELETLKNGKEKDSYLITLDSACEHLYNILIENFDKDTVQDFVGAYRWSFCDEDIISKCIK